MPSENDPNSIGNPEPVHASENEGLLVWLGSILLVVVGGSVAFATLVAPTRLSGAARSARLKWQERQAEIDRAVASDSTHLAPAAQTAQTTPAKPDPE